MEEDIKKLLKKKKVLTLADVSNKFNCPKHKAKYYIKKCGAVTSFNKNGKYYSLPEIIQFDDNGFWEYNDIRFSEHGTLKGTIIAIINNSESGLSSYEVAELMKCSPHTMLSELTKGKKIQRKKIGACYIYFSTDKEAGKKQFDKIKEGKEQCSAHIISDTVGVFALVEFIQHPELDLQQICRRLNSKGMKITESLLRSFFVYHGILKKTQDF